MLTNKIKKMKERMLKNEYNKLMKSANKYRSQNISLYIQTLVKITKLREVLTKNQVSLQLN